MPVIKQSAAPASMYEGTGPLLPGSVSVRIGAVMHVIEADSAVPPPSPGADRLLIYPTVFYPAVPISAQATPIVVGSAEERAGVDFQFLPFPAAHVSGRALEAVPGGTTILRLFPAGWEDANEAVVAETFGDENGAFTFPAVAPGDYVLKATSAARQEMRWASVAISVGRQDIAEVDFVLRPSLRVSGRVEFDGTVLRSIRQTDIHVSAEAADGSDTSAGPEGVTEAGRFALEHLTGGSYVLRVGGVPDGWMLRSATHAGRDVSDSPLMLASNATDVVITLTDRVTQVTGTVRTAAAAPDPDALVLMFPTDRDAWRDAGPAPRRIRTVRPNTLGEFRITALPAGEYYAVAISDVEMGDDSPSMFATLARGAEVVRLDEGVKIEISLQTRSLSTGR
jgi:hypothetical protein